MNELDVPNKPKVKVLEQGYAGFREVSFLHGHRCRDSHKASHCARPDHLMKRSDALKWSSPSFNKAYFVVGTVLKSAVPFCRRNLARLQNLWSWIKGLIMYVLGAGQFCLGNQANFCVVKGRHKSQDVLFVLYKGS